MGHPLRWIPVTFLPVLTGAAEMLKGAKALISLTERLRIMRLKSPNLSYLSRPGAWPGIPRPRRVFRFRGFGLPPASSSATDILVVGKNRYPRSRPPDARQGGRRGDLGDQSCKSLFSFEPWKNGAGQGSWIPTRRDNPGVLGFGFWIQSEEGLMRDGLGPPERSARAAVAKLVLVFFSSVLPACSRTPEVNLELLVSGRFRCVRIELADSVRTFGETVWWLP